MEGSEAGTGTRVGILLVDDRPDNLLVLEVILSELGHELVAARSGEEALARLREREFAVVLLDVRMAGMDGFETARRLRVDDQVRRTPIIFLTAHDETRERVEEAYALGAVDFLFKPISAVILRAKVAGFVELHQRTVQVRRQAEQLRELERRQFEAERQVENMRFRVLTEYSSDAVLLIDSAACVLYASPSLRHVLGYEPEEFVGQSGFVYLHPDDLGAVQARLAELMQTPAGRVRVETRVRHKDGRWLWVEALGTNLLAEPAVAAIVVNFRDITERHQATTALRDSEERFRQLADHVNAIFWISDPHHQRVLYVSPAYEAIWGRSCQSLYEQPRSFLDGVHPEDRIRVQRDALAAETRGERVDIEYRVIRPDGSERWVRDRGFPVRDAAGAVYRVVGITEDVTQAKTAEHALREREQWFHTLANSIPQLAWMARADGHIIWYNRRFYDYTGKTPRDMHGWGWRSVHDRKELPRVLRSWHAALTNGTPWECTFPLRRHDGALRWHLSRAVPVHDVTGRIVRWFGTNTDITDRIELEAQLKEADRRKDEFLAMLAHELRNPLAPIRNALYVLGLPDAAPTATAQARELVERQVHNMVRLVDDLLDVSRITRGKINLQMEPLDLALVLHRAVEATRPLLDANRHTLTLTLAAPPARVVGDPTRLEQVFANLLNNAAKYTERGGEIWLTTEQHDSAVFVRVRDTGFGIPAGMLPRIFELFAQGDRTLDRAQGGLGIGLTLVRTLVEMHGGTVTAASGGPGRGSEFTVRLPCVPIAPLEPAVAPPDSRGAVPATGTGLRVLVVEDNRDAADSLAMLLGLWGHQVRTAHDGLSGVKAAHSYQPQVVFLDIGLPGFDGYEVARRLRSAFARTVRLIAMTGYGQDEDRRRAQQAGFDAHLVKPVDPEILQQLLAGF